MSRLCTMRSRLLVGSIALAAVVTLGREEASSAGAAGTGDPGATMSARAGEFRVQIAPGMWTVSDEDPEIRVIVEPTDGGAVVYGPLLVGDGDRARARETAAGARLEARTVRFHFPSSESPEDWTLRPTSIWSQTLGGDLRTRLTSSLDVAGTTTYLAHDDVPMTFSLEATTSPGTRFSFGSEALLTEPRLPRLGHFVLRITDPDGGPIPQGRVRLKVAGDWWEFGSEAESTSDGLARLRCIESGSDRSLVTIEAEGYVTRSLRTGDSYTESRWPGDCPGRSTIALTRAPDEPRAVVSSTRAAGPMETLKVEELTGGEIRGRVLGVPPSSKEWVVFAERIGPRLHGYPLPRFVTETQRGEFRFQSVPEGDYHVWLYGHRRAPTSVSTEDPVDVVFDLTPPVRCQVRVVQGGEPLQDLAVQLRPDGSAPVRGFRSVPTTSAAGRAVVDAERDGVSFIPYLERSDPQGGWMFLVLAPIGGDQLRNDCKTGAVIELPDTSVRVRVIDGVEGAAVPGAIITVDNIGVRLEGRAPSSGGVVTLKATTGDGGEVELPGLAPGRWRIVAFGDHGSRRAEQVAELREGRAPVLVELRLEEQD